MKNIISFMQILDFPVNDWEGVCQGCAIMAAQAFTLGPKEYNRYKERLERIALVIDRIKDKYPNLADLIKSKAYSERLKYLVDILKTIPASNNFLDKDEDELISIRAFLESLALAHSPWQFQNQYRIFHPNKSNITQLDTDLISKLSQSKLSEERGGLCKVTSFSHVYNIKEMKDFLNLWQTYLQQKKEKPYYALLMQSRFHTFMLGYDIENKVWFLNNNDEVFHYLTTSTHLRFFEKTDHNTLVKLTKNIFDLLSYINNKEERWVSYPQEEFIVSITIYSTKNQLNLADSILNDKKWKTFHSITSEKAKFKGKIDDTWLYVAAQNNHLDTVKQLISLTDDINQSIDTGQTSIFIAAQNGHTEVVETLIKAGANIDKLSLEVTPLFIAAQNGHTEIVETLIKAGANIDNLSLQITPLFIAAQNGHTEIVETLIKAGANIHTPFKNNETPILVAAKNGHTKVVETLIKAGANVDVPSQNGQSPILIAQKRGHTNTVKVLLNAYVNTNQKLKLNKEACDLYTPLLIAAENGYTEIIEAFIKAGTNFHKLSIEITPLFIAAQKGHINAVKVLLNAYANTNEKFKINEIVGEICTPLFIAALNGHMGVVEALIKAGANIHIPSKNSETPIFVAVRNGHTKTVEVLIEAGANINILSKNDHTPIFIAARNGHTKTVEVLIKAGANINIPSKNGHTPIFIAKKKGHDKVVEILIKAGATYALEQEKDYTNIRPSNR